MSLRFPRSTCNFVLARRLKPEPVLSRRGPPGGDVELLLRPAAYTTTREDLQVRAASIRNGYFRTAGSLRCLIQRLVEEERPAVRPHGSGEGP